MRAEPQTLDQLPTPSLVVERSLFEANVAAMSAAWPGPSLRPHVKAFKSTAIARVLAGAGHENFCAATVREMEGLAAAGLGRDLLLANEVLDVSRLGRLVDAGHRVTVAVDSDATVAAAAAGASPMRLGLRGWIGSPWPSTPMPPSPPRLPVESPRCSST